MSIDREGAAQASASLRVSDRIERLCLAKGLKMTDQRRVLARALAYANDHPNVEEVHRCAPRITPRISMDKVNRPHWKRVVYEQTCAIRDNHGVWPINKKKH